MDIKLKSQLRKITTFIFDVDGVLTDATVIALRGGELARVFNVKDGLLIGSGGLEWLGTRAVLPPFSAPRHQTATLPPAD